MTARWTNPIPEDEQDQLPEDYDDIAYELAVSAIYLLVGIAVLVGIVVMLLVLI